MKRVLLGTSALLGIGIIVSPALAEEPIRISVGGYYKAAYMVIDDDNGVLDEDDNANPQLGHDTNRDGLFSDAEIHFLGSTVLDNGLEVGLQIEVEGEDDFDQVDEAYVWFGGGFGELRVGSDDDALHKACVIPPGGSSNFSAFSPNQWAANSGGLMSAFAGFGDNSICTGVDGDSQKFIYTSPVFGGFQLTASYTPSGGDETHSEGVGTHIGMPVNTPGESRHNTSAALNYSYEGRGWGLAASLGGSWEGHKEEDNTALGGDVSFGEQDFYQAGLNLFIGNFAFGVGGEIYNDLVDIRVESDSITTDSWVAGVGMSYSLDAWIFGAQYSHREDEFAISTDEGTELDLSQDRVVGTVTYLFGPGMNFDASVGYTWLDADPEDFAELGGIEGLDDYQAIEIGVGATLTF